MDLSKFTAKLYKIIKEDKIIKENKTVREHTDDLLNNLEFLNDLGYINKESIYNLTKIACEYHDYGKVNREFQNRIKNETKFNEKKEIAHNVLSLYFINPDDFEEEKDYYRVCFAVLYHHYYCDGLKVLSEKTDLIENLLSEFETYELDEFTPMEIGDIKSDDEAILIKGFLNKCDFSASGNTEIEYKNNFLEESLERLLNSWKIDNKEAKWNELQQFAKNNRDNNIMVVAQTGMGKTEAGLHWIGNNKGFFILPLKTAINAIYDRVSNGIVKENNNEEKHKVALIHSDSLSYYISQNEDTNIVLDHHREGKQLSIPISIATLDQIFDFVFKYKGYEVKLATLSYSKVVIDEIQMYSADLLAYLILGIKTIIRLGGKVAILTATLAPFVKDLLLEDNNKLGFVEGKFVNELKRHNLKIYDDKINADVIYNKYIDNKEKKISNKILVVCNTIKKAQEIYNELKDKNIDNLNILHSKFIKRDRAYKEEQILEFGKTNHIGDGIWISTQIVEASLDIDFDYLFTELSDINALFQRLGRCNRKGVKPAYDYNCYVFLQIERNLLTNGDKGFIDKKIYELSKEALRNVDGLLSEEEKVNIINRTLTTENIKGSDYWSKYTEFFDYVSGLNPYEVDKKDVKLRNIISFDIIPQCIYEKNESEIESLLEIINDEKTDKINRIKSIDKIKSFTVSVGQYDIELLKNKLIMELEVGKYERIPVYKCNYSELGFTRNTKEDVYDNFI
ncbi:TPA: CRISPR-associated helicase Cas3' [Clostridium perfringens]